MSTEEDRSIAQQGGQNSWEDHDVTAIVQKWVKRSVENYGLRIKPESASKTIRYASSDNSDQNIRPKLVITYDGGTVSSVNKLLKVSVGQHRAEIKGRALYLTLAKSGGVDVDIYSANGKLIYSTASVKTERGINIIPLSKNYSSGIFLVRIKGEGFSFNTKVAIEK